MSSPDEDEAPEGWIEALVAATAEFLPGVGVIPLVAINKAWRDGARTALFRGRCDVQCARTAAADFLGVTFRARLVRRGQSDPEAKERCILETSC